MRFCSRCLCIGRNNKPKQSNKFNEFNLDDEITNATWKSTIPFIPPIMGGKVIKVYDGDTITIASKLPSPYSPLYRFSVRINGIDCPEIKGKNDAEKECAKIARNKLCDIILDKVVILKNVGVEKYGRILADVYYEDHSISEWLLQNNLAVPYDGGTKVCPDNWMEYHNKVNFTDIYKCKS